MTYYSKMARPQDLSRIQATPSPSITTPPTSNITTSPSQFQQQITPIPTPTPKPTPQTMFYIGPSGKKILRIALYKLVYSSDETITALISNETPQTFYAVQGPSGGSYCQVLMIEQKKGSFWQETGICGSAMPDRAFEIPFGSKKEVFSFPKPIGNPSSLPSGIYRLRLDYYESDPFWTNNPPKETVYSQEFQIL